jgi:Tfp pilus assembly protein PilO
MKNIVSIILVVVAIVLFVTITNPRYATVRTLMAEQQRFDDALERSKELIALRDALLAKLNAIDTANINRLDRMLPDSIDTVRLIIDINTLASRYGMSLANISIGTPDAPESEGMLGPSSDEFGRLSLSFTVASNYQNFRAFLGDLERSLRLMDITSISFGEPEDSGMTAYNISFTTYWLK